MLCWRGCTLLLSFTTTNPSFFKAISHDDGGADGFSLSVGLSRLWNASVAAKKIIRSEENPP